MATEVRRGRDARILLAPAGGALVDITADAVHGVDNLTSGVADQTRPIPGRVRAEQRTTTTGTTVIGVDATEVTDPILWGRFGGRFELAFRPRGTGAGLPQQSVDALATIDHVFEDGGARRYAVRLVHDGAVNEAVQA